MLCIVFYVFFAFCGFFLLFYIAKIVVFLVDVINFELIQNCNIGNACVLFLLFCLDV